MPKIAPLVSSRVRLYPLRVDLLPVVSRINPYLLMRHATQPSLKTRNSPLSECERDPSNSSKMIGIFDSTNFDYGAYSAWRDGLFG